MRARIALTAVAAAVAVNLAIFAVGRATGGTFRFTQGAKPITVDAATVAGFTAMPLLAGLVLVALTARRWPWVVTAALIVAPSLAVVTILLMTVPADFDTTSTVTLGLCHLALVPIAILSLRSLRGATATPAAPATTDNVGPTQSRPQAGLG